MPSITITGLEGLPLFPTALTVLPVGNGQRVLGVLYNTTEPKVIDAVAKAYLVGSDWHATEIGSSDPIGKDVGTPALERAGRDLIMYISETPPGGGGSSAQAHVYVFEGVLPPLAPAPTIDLDARRQATAATNIANSAHEKIAALQAAGTPDEVARTAIHGLAVGLRDLGAQFD